MTHALTLIVAGREISLIHAKNDPQVHRLRVGSVTHSAPGGYVWPLGKNKRRWFKFLRRHFGDAGLVAAWTRCWRGPWVVVLPGGHVRLPGTFRTHAQAVRVEVLYMTQRILRQ